MADEVARVLRVKNKGWNGLAMRCPKCAGTSLRVTNSRNHNHTVRRRRKCNHCGHTWNTMEVECDAAADPVTARTSYWRDKYYNLVDAIKDFGQRL